MNRTNMLLYDREFASDQDSRIIATIYSINGCEHATLPAPSGTSRLHSKGDPPQLSFI